EAALMQHPLRTAAWTALALFALVLPASAQAPAPAAPNAAPAAVTVTVAASVVGEGITPSRGAEPTDIPLAKPVTLEITVSAPTAIQLFPPDPRVDTGPFTLLEIKPFERTVAGATATEVYRLVLMPMRLGVEKIPAIEIAYRQPGSDVQGSVTTEIVKLWVRGNLENEQDPALGPPPPPVEIITTNWLLIWALSIFGTLVIAALLTWFVLRALDARFEALAPLPPPAPANELALSRLDALSGRSDAEVDGAKRLAEIIDILREYLGGRYRFDALEMTSKELLAALDGQDLKSITATEVEALLNEADFVKFARITPSEDAARAHDPTVRRIVEATWEVPEPDEEAEEVVVLETATLKQRLYGGGIDAAIAGALALLLLTGLFIGGNGDFGWLALILFGLVMTVRDLVGGQSIGKRILGIHIVQRREDQPQARPGQLLQRNLLWLVWPLTAPLEVGVLRRHPLKLRVGDLYAKTEVVQGEHT
ncbi:MAG: putative RDD family membrane protein YckC, partial [Myxococcota bacterium]